MNLYSFIYLCFIYFFFTLYNSTDIINYKFQILFSGILISTFGIAHGSIDNFLVKKRYDLNNFEFYSLYLVSIVLYIIVWLVSPKIAFLSFLLLSAYHFGESHFSDYNILTYYKKIFYMIWGCMLISGLLFFNKNELIELSTNYNNSNFLFLYNFEHLSLIFYLLSFISFIILIILTIKKELKIQELFSELIHFFLIVLTFYLFPILLSFTLYFIFIHSLRSLNHEFKYLKTKIKNFNMLKFFLILLPHTVIAQVFIILTVVLIHMEIIKISIPIALLMIISSVTFPHAIVMTKFYNK